MLPPSPQPPGRPSPSPNEAMEHQPGAVIGGGGALTDQTEQRQFLLKCQFWFKQMLNCSSWCLEGGQAQILNMIILPVYNRESDGEQGNIEYKYSDTFQKLMRQIVRKETSSSLMGQLLLTGCSPRPHHTWLRIPAWDCSLRDHE